MFAMCSPLELRVSLLRSFSSISSILVDAASRRGTPRVTPVRSSLGLSVVLSNDNKQRCSFSKFLQTKGQEWHRSN